MDARSTVLPDTVEELQDLARELGQQLEAERTKLEAEREESERLRELVRLFTQKRFGPSSEEWNQDQLQIFNEAEATALTEDTLEDDDVADEGAVPESSPKARKNKGRRPLPAHLPRQEKVHDLPEDVKVCAQGHAMVRIGEETSEQLEITPPKIWVTRNVRPKYACPQCEDQVVIADVPKQPIPKSQASPSLLAQIAVSKYCDGLPLYRQSNIFRRIDIDLNRTTLANWIVKIGQLFQSVVNLLRDDLLSEDIAHCDETPLKVLKEPGKKAQSQSYIWVQRGGTPDRPIILFDYDPTRSRQVPQRLFDGFAGWLHVDGYTGYDELFAKNPKIRRVGCMAHCRRRFDEAVKAQPKGKGSAKQKKAVTKAHQGLAFTNKLYRIEKELRGLGPDERKSLREERAVPVLREMKAWLDAARDQVPPKTLTGKAIAYALGQWDALCRYVEDGRLEIDNNRVENAIRPFVLGRKNFLFSASVAGAEASANLYSVIETAKANGLEPQAYLRHLLTELPKATSVEKIEALLPTRWRPED